MSTNISRQRRVLYAQDDSQPDSGNDTALPGQDLRPLLRFGRNVRAEHEIHRGAPRQQERHFRLWTGIYQHHL